MGLVNDDPTGRHFAPEFQCACVEAGMQSNGMACALMSQDTAGNGFCICKIARSVEGYNTGKFFTGKRMICTNTRGF